MRLFRKLSQSLTRRYAQNKKAGSLWAAGCGGYLSARTVISCLFAVNSEASTHRRWYGQWPLQRLRLVPGRSHPGVTLFVGRQDYRQCLGMDRLDRRVRLGSQEAVIKIDARVPGVAKRRHGLEITSGRASDGCAQRPDYARSHRVFWAGVGAFAFSIDGIISPRAQTRLWWACFC